MFCPNYLHASRSLLRVLAQTSLIAALIALAAPLAFANKAKDSSQPPAAAAAEAVALPDGSWLGMEKRELVWRAASGDARAKLAVRGKQLDARLAENGEWIGALLDSDAAQPIIVRGGANGMARSRASVSTNFSIEAMCLYRDGQGLTHGFFIGRSGVAEQWLLSDGEHRLVRQLALAPHPAACRADDARQTLFVSEHGVGVWAFDLARESMDTRSLVAQMEPWGSLKKDAGAIAVLGSGAIAVADGNQLRWVAQQGKRWVTRDAGVKVGDELDKIAVRPAPFAARAGKPVATQLWVHDKGQKTWREVRVPPLPTRAPTTVLPIIEPVVQTEPVARFGDAADDPAIWIHPTDSTRSRVLGTNKKQGLLVYDLEGKQLQLLEVGRINNVDVRQGVAAGGRTWDLAVATQRDEQSLVIFSIDAEGKVKEEGRVGTELGDIYGVCAGRSRGNQLDVYANDKDGRFVHVRIDQRDGKWVGEVKRRFKVASQPEGCVVDETQDLIFVGEERKGVWVLSSRDDVAPKLNLVLGVGSVLHADVEGLALYQNGARSYLVVSSQGNDSYVVLDSRAPYKVHGSFRIGINPARSIDAVSETDGIEVTSRPLGVAFPRGMLVAQDGYKFMPNGPQNFKLVSWDDIARALKLP
jgi:3-phytase